MTMQDIGLFGALKAKMDFLGQRHGLLAQNIANADTPGYRPKDLVEVDFSQFFPKPGAVKSSLTVAATNEGHIDNTGDTQQMLKARKGKDMYEVAPTGNAVILEEQLMKSSQNVMDYNLMVNVYQKQVGMIRTALGK